MVTVLLWGRELPLKAEEMLASPLFDFQESVPGCQRGNLRCVGRKEGRSVAR